MPLAPGLLLCVRVTGDFKTLHMVFKTCNGLMPGVIFHCLQVFCCILSDALLYNATLLSSEWLQAGVAELVDAPDLGSGDASRGGSTPSARTILF